MKLHGQEITREEAQAILDNIRKDEAIILALLEEEDE